MAAQGAQVVTHFVQTDTRLGEFMEIAPTGRRIEFTEISILRIDNGKVVESSYQLACWD